MVAPVAASLPPLFAAAGSAGGATALTSFGASVFAGGASILGGAIAGIGEMQAAKGLRKMDEEAKIAEEKRRQANYEGVGQATRFWDREQAAPLKSSVSPSLLTPQQPTAPSVKTKKYNPATGKIENI